MPRTGALPARLRSKFMEEGYCVKCREKREIKDIERVEMENGRKALKGVCPVCGTKITRFVKDDAW
jgi:hypothetical protein